MEKNHELLIGNQILKTEKDVTRIKSNHSQEEKENLEQHSYKTHTHTEIVYLKV